MSLIAILEAIRLSGEAAVEEIETRASEQASELLAKAQLEAQQIEEDVCAKEVMPAFRERARIIHRARLEGLRITGNVREALIDAALSQARGRLSSLRSSTIYPAVLRRLTQETLAELEGSLEEVRLCRLEADPRDQKLLENVLDDIGLNLPVSYTRDCWGGLIGQSQDGRVVVINTLESRLERATPFLRRYLAALFENEQTVAVNERRVEPSVVGR